VYFTDPLHNVRMRTDNKIHAALCHIFSCLYLRIADSDGIHNTPVLICDYIFSAFIFKRFNKLSEVFRLIFPDNFGWYIFLKPV
jgi:hypothetical protein